MSYQNNFWEQQGSHVHQHTSKQALDASGVSSALNKEMLSWDEFWDKKVSVKQEQVDDSQSRLGIVGIGGQGPGSDDDDEQETLSNLVGLAAGHLQRSQSSSSLLQKPIIKTPSSGKKRPANKAVSDTGGSVMDGDGAVSVSDQDSLLVLPDATSGWLGVPRLGAWVKRFLQNALRCL